MRLGGFGNVHRADFHHYTAGGVVVEAGIQPHLVSIKLEDNSFDFAWTQHVAERNRVLPSQSAFSPLLSAA
jgi:hypothetical protein